MKTLSANPLYLDKVSAFNEAIEAHAEALQNYKTFSLSAYRDAQRHLADAERISAEINALEPC